jgi:hypothetical protein
VTSSTPPPVPGSAWHVEDWLDRYRTGELPEPEERRVTAHLEKCAECTRKLAELEEFSALLSRGFAAEHALRVGGAEPDWERQRGEVLARSLQPGRRAAAGAEPVPPVRKSPVLLRYLPQAAMAVLAGIVLGVLYQQGVRSPGQAERSLRKDAAESSRATAVPREVPGSAPAPDRGFPDPTFPDQDRLSAERDGTPSDQASDRASERSRELFPRGPEDVNGVDARPPEAAPSPEPAAPADRAQSKEKGVAAARAPAPAAADERAAAGRRDGQGVEGAAEAEAGAAAGDFATLEEARADVAAEAEADAAKQPAAPPPAFPRANAKGQPLPEEDLLQRMDFLARKALASESRREKQQALAFWRDSVAHRYDLDPRRKRAAAALVDSLARTKE